MLYTSGIVAAVTVSFVIWFAIVVTALGSALWPLLACDNARPTGSGNHFSLPKLVL